MRSNRRFAYALAAASAINVPVLAGHVKLGFQKRDVSSSLGRRDASEVEVTQSQDRSVRPCDLVEESTTNSYSYTLSIWRLEHRPSHSNFSLIRAVATSGFLMLTQKHVKQLPGAGKFFHLWVSNLRSRGLTETALVVHSIPTPPLPAS